MTERTGKTAVVTGGNAGIGLAVASALAGEGMAVAVAARNEEKLAKAASRLEDNGARVIAVPTDVSERQQVERLIDKTMDAFGRIDVLVNNAGVLQRGEIVEMTDEDWDRTMAINLRGAFLCTRAVLPAMKRQGSGYVINISSVAGKVGIAGSSAYSASKFGMIGLTESLLKEAAGSGVRATSICPAYVDTPMAAGATISRTEMIPTEDIASLVTGLLKLAPQTVIREIVVERVGIFGG